MGEGVKQQLSQTKTGVVKRLWNMTLKLLISNEKLSNAGGRNLLHAFCG